MDAAAASDDAAVVTRPTAIGDETDVLAASLMHRKRRLRRLEIAFWRGPETLPYRGLVIAWAVAVAARCTLSNITGGYWWGAQTLLIAGTLLLLWRGGRIGWALSAVGLLLPILFLRDWMTQSSIMLLIALVGTGFVDGRGRGVGALRGTAISLTGLAYLVAAFHKLNRDFLDPDLSCAIYGMDKLDRLLPNLPLAAPELALPLLAPAVIVIELVLAGLVLARRGRAALLLGIAFHVPLTIALAPAFAFVMGIGLIATLREAELRALMGTLRRRRGVLGGTALAMLVGVALAANVIPIWHTQLKLALFWVLWWGIVWTPWPQGSPGREASHPRPALLERGALWAACAWFVMSAALPYAGTRVQHGGAMLANLRIDEGCWNHLVVPEAVRRVEPYVRIDHAEMGVPRARALGLFSHREESLMRGLWAPEALRRMQRNWCTEVSRPIVLEGTVRGAPLHIADLCAPEAALPYSVGIWGGRAWFPNHLRYQVNLRRECAQACVH